MATRPRNRNTKQTTSKVVTAGAIRMEAPKSQRQPKPRTGVNADIHPVSGFIEFIREHAVVGLAIGFVIATQVQTLVKQLVSSFIDPLFQLLFGKALSQRTFTLHFHGRATNFGWGGFVYVLLDFLFVLAAIYAIVKFFKLDKLDQPKKK